MSEHYLSLYEEAKKHWQPLHAQMQVFKAANNDETTVPLPELDKIERSAVPNLARQAAAHMADSLASVVPTITIDPLKPGQDASRARAAATRGALRWWMKKSNSQALLHQKAFWLPSYGMAPSVVLPDNSRGFSRFEVRDPLSSYPCPPSQPGEVVAPYAFFRKTRSLSWLIANHRDAVGKVSLGPDPKMTDHYELLEYLDADERVVMLLGKRNLRDPEAPGSDCVELSRAPNATKMSWCVVPYRMTLDKLLGQFDGMLGMHRQQALLMALGYIAAKKSVFADPYLEGEGTPELLEIGDGLTGKVGRIKGGRMTYHRPDAVAAQIIQPMLSTLERNQRMDGGVPAQHSGEQPANVRTARAASELLSATVDLATASYHRALADAAAAECEIALVQAKTYWPNRTRTFHLSGKGKQRGDYTPSETFEHTEVDVEYPVAGADAQTLTIMTGQLLGIGLMSQKTARQLHPLIKDEEAEYDNVTAESLDRAGLAAIEQQAAAGEIPAVDIAYIKKLIKSENKSWEEAVEMAQERAQKRQAEQVAPEDPAAQPGLSMPGMGAEAGGPIPGNGPEQADLSTLLRQMHTTRQNLPA